MVGNLAVPLMLQALDDGRFDAVVPVPLHRSRLRKRGFNQAELLARGVAERINATVSDTLEVVRSTRDQVELSAAQRRANVAGAYKASGPLGQSHPHRRRLHHRRNHERLRNNPRARRRAAGREVHALSLCRTC